jgi:hypothetical protein
MEYKISKIYENKIEHKIDIIIYIKYHYTFLYIIERVRVTKPKVNEGDIRRYNE